MYSKNGRATSLAMLAVGGLIGAGAAILLAPQSGKKTRRDIRHIGRVARNRSEKVLLDVGRKTSRVVDSLSERLQNR